MISVAKALVTVTMLGCLRGSALTAQGAVTKNIDHQCVREGEDGKCALYVVSLLQLIVTPERWDGKVVSVAGFMHLEFEGDGLYLHREDFTQGLSQNAIWIGSPARGYAFPKQCYDHYVSLIGRFRADDRGHMGAFSGALTEITNCFSRLADGGDTLRSNR